MLKPHFLALEDRTGTLSATELLKNPNALVPLDALPKGSSTSYYWLKTTLQTSKMATDPGEVLSFNNLTYVDVYLYQGDSLISHQQAGAFRGRNYIAESDGRFFVTLPLQPGGTYTLLLQVHHTKHYQPVFDFTLQTRRSYYQKVRLKESLNSALQGAVCLFFVHTLLSWLVTRYRPYLWLQVFIAGVGLYAISSAGYFIEWFFPDDPPTGWLFNKHFVNLGMFGLFLLVRDFWQIPSNYPRYYSWMKWMPGLLIASSLTYFLIDYLTGNYNLTNTIQLWEHPVFLALAVSALVTCWKNLNPSHRWLAYGIILIGSTGLTITITSVFLHERSLAIAPVFGDIAILCVFLLFSIGLKEEMRQHEVAKQAVLKEFNNLQQHQNIILEKKVEERTEELKISNRRLQKQKFMLAERNAKIETLINELNHRVKNNLQLLYSLLSLQLPIVKDGISRDILKGNIGKIRAMMLVNQKLFNFDNGHNVSLCEFITELAVHLQKIYDTKGQTRIQQNIPAGIQLSDKHTLSFGLILSELFTNTFKHAFRDHPDPCIRVEAQTLSDHLLQFVYTDNGNCISEHENQEKFTMGIPLIKDLTRQMNGQMTVSKDKGLSYSFTIPV
jgi:two-component sensor histidine kinase